MSETVKLIIEIPKKVFEARKTGEISPWVTVPILDAVQNGILLPKGHGRLIDADKLKEVYENTEDAEHCQWTLCGVTSEIDDALTIVKADKPNYMIEES